MESFFVKIVAIKLFNLVNLPDAAAKVIFYHQLRQLAAVDKDDFDIQTQRCFSSTCRKLRGRNEHTFASALAGQCTDEFVDLGAVHSITPTLGLQVNHIQTELIFFDDPINTIVIGRLRSTTSFLA